MEELSIADAELVGAWGLSIEWHDGHNTGIFPWTSLRRWYEGEADGVKRDEPAARVGLEIAAHLAGPALRRRPPSR